jgi:hypothetical protein
MKGSRLKEFVLLSLGGIGVLAIMFCLLYLIISLDDSPHKCATKVASKVYDSRCF